MQYKKANDIFPQYLLIELQRYAEGCTVYIPKKSENRKEWGAATNTKSEISERNINIRGEFINGKSFRELSCKYFLSVETIRKIIYSK